ncbi:hypothetical protein [Amantichitinum ursilacus]|uniref:Uncharacterized protein n=1 Tax=Amantichitinum ursilacus TaxID=857265 RepID=A0A0N0GP81_9NEIS|nr:hypothetical protein [Amantichitinum ursilacus]KPC53507.1 hypothetical protein WG78_08300 [Amantichitinum ursilacus]
MIGLPLHTFALFTPAQARALTPALPAAQRTSTPPTRGRRFWRDTMSYLHEPDAVVGADGWVHRRQVVRF